jgi:hypothetical protein
MPPKKRHHFIAQTYLRPFTDGKGKVWTYSKDKRGQTWAADTSAVAFEKYYYSQPLLGGGQDHERLENNFSQYESRWPSIVQQIGEQKKVDGSFQTLLDFVCIHRVRIPTTRNMVERMDAEAVRMQLLILHDEGKLPDPPEQLGRDWEEANQNIVVTIDPHRSIHAMPLLIEGFVEVLNAMGFEILKNTSGIPFVTTDNPVCYFDPTANETLMQPYTIDRRVMNVELFFPMTPEFLLWGHSMLKGALPHYRDLSDAAFVERVNRTMVRFADRFIFANSKTHCPLVNRYSAMSPTVEIKHIVTTKGRGLTYRTVFGERKPKPKWKTRKE